MSSPAGSFVAVCGDVHGHLQLALVAWALEQHQTGRSVDAILLCGDVGTFTEECPPDKATVRHARDNPCEVEFLAWSAEPPATWLEGIFAPLEDGGLGLGAPVIIVTGNHEGSPWIELVLEDVAERSPQQPLDPCALPAVDARGRIRLLPSGWRVRTPAGRVFAGIGGIQPGLRLSAGYPDSAYIASQAVDQCRGRRDVDILITHQGPAQVQGTHSGAEILDPLLDDPSPTLWFDGHSRQRREPMTIGATTVHTLGDATFDRSANWRVGRVAWAGDRSARGGRRHYPTAAAPQRAPAGSVDVDPGRSARRAPSRGLGARRPVTVDITSSRSYPANVLSNFAAHPFRLRGWRIASMEGLLQGLKCRSPETQAHIFTLIGRAAKKAGAQHDWETAQILFWRETPIDRHGTDYQRLLDEAYGVMFAQSHRARRALPDTGDAVLTHSIGGSDPRETVLTEAELCDRLMRIRQNLRAPTAGRRGRERA